MAFNIQYDLEDMNTRKIYAILTALITGGLFVTIGGLTGHAEAALMVN